MANIATAPLNGAVTWLPASLLSAPHALKSSAGSGLSGWGSNAGESKHQRIRAASVLSQRPLSELTASFVLMLQRCRAHDLCPYKSLVPQANTTNMCRKIEMSKCWILWPSHGWKCAHTEGNAGWSGGRSIAWARGWRRIIGIFFLIELKVKKQTLNFYSFDVGSGALASAAANNLQLSATRVCSVREPQTDVAVLSATQELCLLVPCSETWSMKTPRRSHGQITQQPHSEWCNNPQKSCC